MQIVYLIVVGRRSDADVVRCTSMGRATILIFTLVAGAAAAEPGTAIFRFRVYYSSYFMPNAGERAVLYSLGRSGDNATLTIERSARTSPEQTWTSEPMKVFH